jgi:iron-sulfur cluster assembly protein
MLKVTVEAAKQIRQAAMQSGADELALRVAAKRDPQGSIEYGMGFDVERANDIQVVSEGVTVLISHHSKELLIGTVLDFVELNPGDFQFIFVNPNDAESKSAGGSGCGSTGCGSGGSGTNGCH